MPVVIKDKTTGKYLGKYSIEGNRQAVTDIKKAKRYMSMNKAKAAIASMGYLNFDYREVEFVEVEA